MPKKGKKADIFSSIEDGDETALKAYLQLNPLLISSVNKDGWSPLHAAAYHGQSNLVDILLAAGSKINAVCKDGDTAIHYASAQGETDVIEQLFKAGAKLSLADNDGQTPLDVAHNKKTKKIIEQFLLETENKSDSEKEDWDDDDGAVPLAEEKTT